MEEDLCRGVRVLNLVFFLWLYPYLVSLLFCVLISLHHVTLFFVTCVIMHMEHLLLLGYYLEGVSYLSEGSC